MVSERVRFESQDVALGGRLVLPDSGLAKIGVLCITGGGLADCDVPYLGWQEYMADVAGLASLSFNARGVGDSDGSFRTDSPGFDPQNSPANSQATRAEDAVVAYRLMKTVVGLHDDKKIGVIGGSMGGDIALHAPTIEPGALVLRAPSAYPNEVHDVAYGPEWGARVRQLGGDEAALQSSNFRRILTLGMPLMLTYSAGDSVVPKNIQDAYIAAVKSVGGIVEIVGDETTPHTYINDAADPVKDTATNRLARDATFAATTNFFVTTLA